LPLQRVQLDQIGMRLSVPCVSPASCIPHHDAGEKQGKSLLGKDEPTIWYEAAAALPPLPATSETVSDEVVEQLRMQVRVAFGQLCCQVPSSLIMLRRVSY
jgi:hypothetical protein